MLHPNPYTSHPPNISKCLGRHPRPGPSLCALCCQPMDWFWSSLESLQLLGPAVSCGRELCSLAHHCNQLSAGVFCGRCRGGCLFLSVCCIPQLLPAAVLGETVTGCSLFTFSISVMSFLLSLLLGACLAFLFPSGQPCSTYPGRSETGSFGGCQTDTQQCRMCPPSPHCWSVSDVCRWGAPILSWGFCPPVTASSSAPVPHTQADTATVSC